MELKAVIFDLDGVVVDTVPLHFNAWKRMFAEYGHDLTFEEYQEKVDGIPRMDGARNVLTDIPKDELEKAATRKQGYFLDALEKEEIPRHEDAIRLINNLKKAGIKRGVISSSKNCRPILEKIGLYNDLDTVITGNDITKGKPDPQIFQMAAKNLGVTANESIICEDAILGVEAGKNGGFKCVGIDRYGKPERLSKADKVVSTFDEVTVDDLKSLVKG